MNEMISTNEMIERVANAFWLHMTFGGNSAPFEQQPKQTTDHYRQAARAAIEAMREPTDQQRNNYFEMKKASGHNEHHSVFIDAEWERAIDAALKE